MDDIDEIYAACIIEYARRHDSETLTGPFYVIGKDARDAFNLPYSESIFRSALSILEKLKILTVYSRSGMQTYYKVEANKFDSTMEKRGLDVRGYQLARDYSEENRNYAFLEAFHDVGPQYLAEALQAYEDVLSEVAGQNDTGEDSDEVEQPISVKSQSWTGLPADFALSEARCAKLVSELEKVQLALEASDLPQHDKAQARALIIGAKALAEAPDPPLDLIWDMIGRANQLAGIASFLVSIITLFMTAAN